MPALNETNLAGDYITVSVTIPATATRMETLLASAVASYGGTGKILQTNILATVTAGTARDAIVFGGPTTQDGYLAAGVERAFPIRMAGYYVARAGVADVTAIVDVYLATKA